MVDNGSSDGTAEALQALRDQRLVVIERDMPLGAAKARNVGIDAARTPVGSFPGQRRLVGAHQAGTSAADDGRVPGRTLVHDCVRLCGRQLDSAPRRSTDRGADWPSEGQLLSSQDLLALLSHDTSSLAVARRSWWLGNCSWR